MNGANRTVSRTINRTISTTTNVTTNVTTEDKPDRSISVDINITRINYPRVVVRKAGILGITKAELMRLPLDELRKLAKKKFRDIIKEHHPDTRKYLRKQKSHRATVRFTQCLNCYRFFSRLTSSDLELFKANNISMPWYPLPWHWEKRPCRMPWGFHDVRR